MILIELPLSLSHSHQRSRGRFLLWFCASSDRLDQESKANQRWWVLMSIPSNRPYRKRSAFKPTSNSGRCILRQQLWRRHENVSLFSVSDWSLSCKTWNFIPNLLSIPFSPSGYYVLFHFPSLSSELQVHCLFSHIKSSSWRNSGVTPSLARTPTQTPYSTTTRSYQSFSEDTTSARTRKRPSSRPSPTGSDTMTTSHFSQIWPRRFEILCQRIWSEIRVQRNGRE